MLRRLLTAAAVLAAVACGNDDNGVGPSGVTFPSIPASLLSTFCVQGERTVGQAISGTLSATDCDSIDFDSTSSGAYFEIWRFRVSSARSVTFTANSGFDNYLEVYQLLSYTATTVTTALIGEDDDNGPLLNAMLTVNLQPNTDYFLVVSGFDYTEVGSYSVTSN